MPVALHRRGDRCLGNFGWTEGLTTKARTPGDGVSPGVTHCHGSRGRIGSYPAGREAFARALQLPVSAGSYTAAAQQVHGESASCCLKRWGVRVRIRPKHTGARRHPLAKRVLARRASSIVRGHARAEGVQRLLVGARGAVAQGVHGARGHVGGHLRPAGCRAARRPRFPADHGTHPGDEGQRAYGIT